MSQVIAPSVDVTRRISWYPNPGNLDNPTGPAVRVITEHASGDDVALSSGSLSHHYVVAPIASYIARSVGIDEYDYIASARYEWQDITANIAGGNRKYIGFQSMTGRVTPAQASILRRVIESAMDIPGNLWSHILSIVTPDVSINGMTFQPLPSHHTGMIRVESFVRGTSLEGGAATGNTGTFANVNMTIVQEIMTETFRDFMRARKLWNHFMLATSVERRRQISIFQGYTKQREQLIRSFRSGQNSTSTTFPPDPFTDYQVHPYIWWAWARRLDPTAPPPDGRRESYPTNIYQPKRTWFINDHSGLPLF